MTPEQIKMALKCCGDGCAYGCPYDSTGDRGFQCTDKLCKDALELIESLEKLVDELREDVTDLVDQKAHDRYINGLDDMCKAYQTIYYEMNHDDKIKYFDLEYSYEIMYKVEPMRIIAGVSEYRSDKAKAEHDKQLEMLRKTVNEFGGMDVVIKALHELEAREEHQNDKQPNTDCCR